MRVITAVTGASFAGGTRAPKLLGYDGIVPGPVLRGKQGEELRFRLLNQLAQPTTVHWHGIALPNAMDGVPNLTQAAIAPGESCDYRFRAPDAGTFWYHAQSAEHRDQGLYGALIIAEQQTLDVDRELILMLSVPPEMAATRQLDTILLNGLTQPEIAVEPGERLRLRVINATGAHGFALQLEGHAVWGMAIDGEPCEPFLARESRLGLGPGSRIDVCVDATLKRGASASLLEGMRGQRPIARLVYGSGGRPVRQSEPAALSCNPLPARIDLRRRRQWNQKQIPPKPGKRPAQQPDHLFDATYIPRPRVHIRPLRHPLAHLFRLRIDPIQKRRMRIHRRQFLANPRRV